MITPPLDLTLTSCPQTPAPRDHAPAETRSDLSILDLVEVARHKEYLVARPRSSLTSGDRTAISVTDLAERCDLFNDAHIPAVFLPASLATLSDSHHNTPALCQVVRWIQHWTMTNHVTSEGFILSGPNGIGKSFALAALVRFLTIQHARTAWFITFEQLLHDFKACFQGKDDEATLWTRLRRIEVLGLDDVASTRPSEWTRDILRTIIAYRYNACATTMLTTNLPLFPGTGLNTHLTLADWTGNHCFSRLMQMCYVLPVTGPDLRKKALSHNNTLVTRTCGSGECS